MVDGVVDLSCQEGGDFAVHVNTGKSHTAATEDGALDSTAVHGDGGIASHTAVGIIGVEEVTSATEDVAIPSGEAVSADVSAIVNSDLSVAQHVVV